MELVPVKNMTLAELCKMHEARFIPGDFNVVAPEVEPTPEECAEWIETELDHMTYLRNGGDTRDAHDDDIRSAQATLKHLRAYAALKAQPLGRQLAAKVIDCIWDALTEACYDDEVFAVVERGIKASGMPTGIREIERLASAPDEEKPEGSDGCIKPPVTESERADALLGYFHMDDPHLEPWQRQAVDDLRKLDALRKRLCDMAKMPPGEHPVDVAITLLSQEKPAPPAQGPERPCPICGEPRDEDDFACQRPRCRDFADALVGGRISQDDVHALLIRFDSLAARAKKAEKEAALNLAVCQAEAEVHAKTSMERDDLQKRLDALVDVIHATSDCYTKKALLNAVAAEAERRKGGA